MTKSYVKFSVPAPLQAKTLEVVSQAAKSGGSIRKGTNEATKAIERSEAKLVIIAEDVDPEEIVMHLPIICTEKNIPYTYVSSKIELGKSTGINVPTAAIAICKAGVAEDGMRDILVKIRELLHMTSPSTNSKPPAEKAKKPSAEKSKKTSEKEEETKA